MYSLLLLFASRKKHNDSPQNEREQYKAKETTEKTAHFVHFFLYGSDMNKSFAIKLHSCTVIVINHHISITHCTAMSIITIDHRFQPICLL